jgi:oxygen-independent coproporphyrinogen-3 oxidase
MSQNNEAALYIHIPLCTTRCSYCDFYSERRGDFSQDPGKRLVQRILADTTEEIAPFDYVPTVYIGGGTPSLLDKNLETLLKGLQKLLPNSPQEFTIEANPESANVDFFKRCQDYGLTRISLGVQSFSEATRAAVHRAGSAALVCERLELANLVFKGDLSIDLMAGLPFQNSIEADIEKALSFAPSHISFYELNPPAGFHFDPEKAEDLWLRGRDLLETRGYACYEVSNFCLTGKECLHNKRYWKLENWIGVGPSASGTIIKGDRGVRRTVKPDLRHYLEEKTQDLELLDRKTLIKEKFLMGLRMSDGLDTGLFQECFACSPAALVPKTLAGWRARGLFREEGFALTKQGLIFLNSFLAECFCEIDLQENKESRDLS